MSMKKVDAKLSDLYLHNTESTTDRSNKPSNESDGPHKDDGGMRDCLSVCLRVCVTSRIFRSFLMNISIYIMITNHH